MVYNLAEEEKKNWIRIRTIIILTILYAGAIFVNIYGISTDPEQGDLYGGTQCPELSVSLGVSTFMYFVIMMRILCSSIGFFEEEGLMCMPSVWTICWGTTFLLSTIEGIFAISCKRENLQGKPIEFYAAIVEWIVVYFILFMVWTIRKFYDASSWYMIYAIWTDKQQLAQEQEQKQKQVQAREIEPEQELDQNQVCIELVD